VGRGSRKTTQYSQGGRGVRRHRISCAGQTRRAVVSHWATAPTSLARAHNKQKLRRTGRRANRPNIRKRLVQIRCSDQTLRSFGRVRGQDIGTNHGQDIGYRCIQKMTSVARRSAQLADRGHPRKMAARHSAKAVCSGLRHVSPPNTTTSMSHTFFDRSNSALKNAVSSTNCYLCLGYAQEPRPTKGLYTGAK
jgi:hypothetical protein